MGTWTMFNITQAVWLIEETDLHVFVSAAIVSQSKCTSIPTLP